MLPQPNKGPKLSGSRSNYIDYFASMLPFRIHSILQYLRRGIPFLLAVFILFSRISTLKGQDSTSKPLSLAVSMRSNNRVYTGTIAPGIGLRWGDHQFSAYWPNLVLTRWYTLGLEYRYYLPHAGKGIRPFLSVGAGFGKVPVFGVISYPAPIGSRPFGGRAVSAQVDMGADYRLFHRVYGFTMFGYGVTKVRQNLKDSPVFPVPGIQLGFGLKYDILLRGSIPEENSLPEDYGQRSRLFISYRWKFQPSDFGNDQYIGSGATAHQFTAELGVLPWMRITGGLQMGGLENASDTLAFAIQGAGLGLKMHLYQWKRLAFFHDIGFFYLRRPEYRYYSSRFVIGNSLEYNFGRGLYLYAGETMGITDAFFILDFHLGVTVSPGEIFR
jgi:hypothetical protein